MEQKNLSKEERNKKEEIKNEDLFIKAHYQQQQERIESKRRPKVLIIDPSPKKIEFYGGFFPNEDLYFVGTVKEGLRLFEEHYKRKEIEAVIIDDSLGDKAPLVVSLLRSMIKKEKLNIGILVTYSRYIDTTKYFVKPDATISKDSGQIDAFF